MFRLRFMHLVYFIAFIEFLNDFDIQRVQSELVVVHTVAYVILLHKKFFPNISLRNKKVLTFVSRPYKVLTDLPHKASRDPSRRLAHHVSVKHLAEDLNRLAFVHLLLPLDDRVRALHGRGFSVAPHLDVCPVT